MAGEMVHLPKISYGRSGIAVEISLDRFSRQFAAAQSWLSEQVLADSKPEMPHRTGSQQQRSYVTENARQVVFPGPYGRFLYMGKVMVDPDTGSPWARHGAKKEVTDRDLTYLTGGPFWFDTAKDKHSAEWVAGVKERAGGG